MRRQSLTWVATLAFLVGTSLSGQKGNPSPLRPPPEDQPLVSVTPDNSTTPNRTAGTTEYAEKFWITNIGGMADTNTITCASSANVTCTGTSKAIVTLAPATMDTVWAYYNVGSAGTGRLSLRAAGGAVDSGWYNVPVVGSPGAPIVALRNHNGDNRDRSLCLTSGAGDSTRTAVIRPAPSPHQIPLRTRGRSRQVLRR